MTKQQTPKSIVKEFFKNHPNVIIKSHFRENQLGAAYRESLFAPRTAVAFRQKEIDFDTSLGRSTLYLESVTLAEIDGDLLHIAFGETKPQITYQALCN